MPKDKLSDRMSKRFKTEDKVDVEDPIATAAVSLGKDASTQENIEASQGIEESKDARMHARINESEQESKPKEMPEKVPTSLPERKQTRTKAQGPVRTDVSEEAYIGKGVIIEVLYDQIQQKKHLSNGSFRYKADELEKLEAIYRELEQRKPGRISKNDIARMALIAFYEDYEKNGDESILAQVFKRM